MNKNNVKGCECCAGDKAIYWKNNENNAFIDSKGEMMVVVKDRLIRYKVKYCPNCGRNFSNRILVLHGYFESRCYIL